MGEFARKVMAGRILTMLYGKFPIAENVGRSETGRTQPARGRAKHPKPWQKPAKPERSGQYPNQR
jgi:hypothetical protein